MKKLGWVERRDRMEKVYPDLLKACKVAKGLLEGLAQANIYKIGNVYHDLTEAIEKAEGKEV